MLRHKLFLALACIILCASTVIADSRRIALVVGVNTYRTTAGLPALQHATNDAAALSQTLRRSGFDVVEMTQSAAATQQQPLLSPNLAYVRDQIATVLQTPNLGADDVVIISLHGHGVQFEQEKSKDPRFYFCPGDATIADLKSAADITERNNLLALEELYADLANCPAATKLLIVDACRNDPNKPSVFRSGLASATLPAVAAPPGGIAAFFSCKPTQQAVEDADLKHGVFTHFLVEALEGKADQPVLNQPGDGQITLAELTAYVSNNTYAFVREKYNGLQQSPDIKGQFDATVSLVRISPNRLPGSPSDWPMFRGPDGSGIAVDANPPIEWGGDDNQNIRWKAKLPGPSPSSPIVIGEQVFVTSAELLSGDPDSPEGIVRHFITSFDRRTGEVLWQQSVDGPGRFRAAVGKVDGMPAASTPAGDSRNVYCFFGAAGVVAYSLDGERLWQTPIESGDGSGTGTGWRGSSPVVHWQSLLVNAITESGQLLSLDRLNGSVRWTWSPDAEDVKPLASLTTPVVQRVDGLNVCYVCEPSAWLQLNADTGEVLWNQPGRFMLSFATPVIANGKALLPNRNADLISVLHQPGGSDTSEVPKCSSYTSSPIVIGSRVYGVAHGGIMWSVPLDALDGSSEAIRDRAPSSELHASFVAANDYLYFTSKHDGVFVYRPDANGFGPLVATNKIAGDESAFRGTPAISDRDIFLKSDEYLYCISR